MVEVDVQVGWKVLSVRASVLCNQPLHIVLDQIVQQIGAILREMQSVVERLLTVLLSAGQLEHVERLDLVLPADVDHRVRVLAGLLRRLLDLNLRVGLAEISPSVAHDGRRGEQQNLRLVQAALQQQLDDPHQVLSVLLDRQRWIVL